ncbi:hypothetical protein QCA50_007127 [Cerrena zonata]|uniref:Uncharacterized protein n=1 Tax=Cerrena zonata TaxID=2478898 RepID=A0AAW0G972_9APHY
MPTNSTATRYSAYNGVDEDGEVTVFQSRYVLEVLAGHLVSTEGSMRTDVVHPRGALALTLLAVQIAFQSFETGKFVAESAFNDKSLHEDFDTHIENVDGLIRPSVIHHFDAIIEKARSIANLKSRGTSRSASASKRASRKHAVGSRRAPPLRRYQHRNPSLK